MLVWQSALLNDLASLPRNNTTTKLNDVLYRTRMLRVQALIFAALRAEMPKMAGRDKKQRELIASLEEVFAKVSRTHGIPPGDFPDVAKFRHKLATLEACRDFSKFKRLDDRLLAQLDAIIRDHIGALMSEFEAVPSVTQLVVSRVGGQPERHDASVQGWVPKPKPRAQQYPAAPPALPTALDNTTDPWRSTECASSSHDGQANPVSDPWASTVPNDPGHAVDDLFGRSIVTSHTTLPAAPPLTTTASAALSSAVAPTPAPPSAALIKMESAWAISTAEKAKYDSIFGQMQPEDGRVGGAKVAPVLKRSGLSNAVLRDIWNLVDVRVRSHSSLAIEQQQSSPLFFAACMPFPYGSKAYTLFDHVVYA